MKRADAQKEGPRVLKLFIELILAIFVIESLVMVILHIFIEPLHLSAVAEGFLDSFTLVIFLFPALYLLFYHPLSLEIKKYKQVLGAMQELKTGYGVVIRTALDGFWLADIQGHILEVNNAYCRLSGYSRQELLTMSIPDLEALEKPEDTQRHIQQIMKTGGDRFETKHRCKDGRTVEVEVSVNYLTVDGGRLFAFLRDITERKKNQKLLLESEALNRSLIQTIPFGMDVVDEEGNILYLSPRFEAALGKEAIGKRCWQLYRDDKQQCRDCPLREEIVMGETAVIETDGVLGARSFQINHTGMVYQGKKAVLEIFQDITERKKSEEDLLRLNKELLELDRMKSEFINMASHELRTPIAITREGISQVVEGLRGEIPAQQKRFLSISLNNIDRLVKIVDSIFDVSEIEYSRSELNMEVTDLAALAGKVIANFSQQAKNKGLEIKQGFPGKKIELSIDKERIKQVFANLISNAFDFTDQGSIEIRIQEQDSAIECSVSDTGRGIPENTLPGIFGKFQQSGKGYGPGAKGVGLGLAIAKAIVERHKGKIWVESKPGQGATFTFTLPKENRNDKIGGYDGEQKEDFIS